MPALHAEAVGAEPAPPLVATRGGTPWPLPTRRKLLSSLSRSAQHPASPSRQRPLLRMKQSPQHRALLPMPSPSSLPHPEAGVAVVTAGARVWPQAPMAAEAPLPVEAPRLLPMLDRVTISGVVDPATTGRLLVTLTRTGAPHRLQTKTRLARTKAISSQATGPAAPSVHL